MAKGLAALLGGALLALSCAAYPQGRSDPWEDEEHVDCAAARNPKGCRESPNPARCNEMQAKRAAAREACEGKPAEERKACFREAVMR